MRHHLKNYLIPHEGNGNRPHLLREEAAAVLALAIVLIFGFAVFRGLVVNQTGDFTAAVLPVILVNITNEDRVREGLGELTVNPVLEEAARMKAEHMAEHSYFAHVSPDGVDPWYWFYRAGYEFTEAGENLAVNFADSEDVVDAWMDSPGHRANILSGKFSEIGIAAVKGEYKGKKTIFVVQMFGTPARVAVADTSVIRTLPEEEDTVPTQQPVVAGAAVETTPEPEPTPVPVYVPPAPAPVVPAPPSPQPVAPTPEPVVVAVMEPTPEPRTTLVKEELTAHVDGAVAAAPVVVDDSDTQQVSVWESVGSRPRATVSWIYLMIGLLISFVLLLMVWKQVHATHPRSIAYGCALLTLITLLSYFNWLLLSADLIIV